ncbi:MAG: class I SAM-dependent methyltransferase [Gammaproteobacteria bacterium]|nr:class I SAM-dependent methyltransferase [Gammaproteobacteria bacterium]
MSNHILQFWSSQADKFGTSHSASWGDNYAIDLEIHTIGQHIKEGDKVLDVGCANGYSAIHHLDKHISSITGVDFSESMIREAKKNQRECDSPDKLYFEVGDIRKLRFENDTFDVVYTTRTLINLPTWDEQKRGISECIRVCKVGGKIIFSEAFWEPLVLLNSIRTLKSLAPLVEHDFNRYLKKKYLEEYFLSGNIRFNVIDFSSIYYLGSRFLRELVTNPEDYPGYSNPINEIFYNIEKEYSGGGFGIQQAYVIQKSK